MKVTSTDIKNAFGKYLRLCATEPVYIMKNGQIIAKLLNHTPEDEIIENSFNLSQLYGVDEKMNALYDYDRVAASIEAYDLSRIQLSFDEFERMNKDARNRYEYIDGEVYMLGAPSVYHQRVISRLHIELDRFLNNLPCDVFESPFDAKLLRRKNPKFTNIVQPDLLVLCDWKKDTDENGRYNGVPTLLVEVLSPGNTEKEMLTKLDLYRDSGVEEYWVIDPLKGSSLVYRFDDYKIVETSVFNAQEHCKSFVYKGFQFKVLEAL